MRSKRSFCLLLFGCACADSVDPPPVEVVQTPLSGIVFLAQPAAGASIEVRNLLAGAEDNVAASAVADDQGRWVVDLGALSGDFIVEAMTAEGPILNAIANDVNVGAGSAVVVSPVTTLASGYVRHLLSS